MFALILVIGLGAMLVWFSIKKKNPIAAIIGVVILALAFFARTDLQVFAIDIIDAFTKLGKGIGENMS